MVSSKTKLVGIISISAFVVGIALLVGIFYAISAKEKELQEFVNERAKLRAENAELVALAELVEETEDEREELQDYVLTEDEVIDFLALIETVAAELGVAFEAASLNIQPIEGNDMFANLILGASVEGSYSGVTQMLTLLELLPYQVSVTDVALSRPEGGEAPTWSGRYTVSITQQLTP